MYTIVIVEDEFRIRQGLGKLINKVDLGFRVIGEAENGYEGLKMIQDMEPDIVITDIQMPKSDGLDMIEKAKNMGAECTFIILSGYANFEYAQQGIRLGVNDYLLKPITISAVKELLVRLKEEKQGMPEEDLLSENNYSEVVRDMVLTTRENYGRKLGLEYFSEKYRLTPEYLSNLFAKEMEVPFSSYIKQVRMEKAKDMILNTDMKIYEIACNVGYPDQKYFSKVFKEYTGISPKQFAMNEATR
ncbi:MAG: response regulator [Lachnospiraceae bacterium]|nr:response regulator [Lachnospiraceae bacterium]MDD3616514.1 response regulator [Lachnospiraceae bacterium]